MTIMPICLDCKWLVRDRAGELPKGPMRCKAYPTEVPREILLMRVDHHKPYKGDHGIQFEAV